MVDFNARAEDIGLTHVAIIMDGNGRWAKARMLPRSMGHRAGAKNIERVMRAFERFGVRHLTLFAFSTENWKRPKEEVDALMQLIEGMIDERVLPMLKKDKSMAVHFIGDISTLPESLALRCREVERQNGEGAFVLNIALNYGGRDDIVHAVNAALRDGHTVMNAETIGAYLYTSHSPEPDLLIRTGGEYRISNFLLWQLAYTEFIFTNTLWPDFSEDEIFECIREFARRKRRFGALNADEDTKE